MLSRTSLPPHAEIARLTPSPRSLDAGRHPRNPLLSILPLLGCVITFSAALLQAPLAAQIGLAFVTVTLFGVQRVLFFIQDHRRRRIATWSRLIRDSLVSSDALDADRIDRALRGPLLPNHPDVPSPNIYRKGHPFASGDALHADTVVVEPDGSIVTFTSVTEISRHPW